MKRFSVITVVAVVTMLVLASIAMAYPGDYYPGEIIIIGGEKNYVGDTLEFRVDLSDDVTGAGSYTFELKKNGTVVESPGLTYEYFDDWTGWTVTADTTYANLLKEFKVKLTSAEAAKYELTVKLINGATTLATGTKLVRVTPLSADGANYHLDPRMNDINLVTFSDGTAIVNANRTGEKVGAYTEYRRVANYPSVTYVHTDFQKNTNSCASCHMTHTAQGAKLLFRAGVFATCAACHDGSGINRLNVFRPSDELVSSSDNAKTFNGDYYAKEKRVTGTFGVDPKMNASVHLATGDVTVAAAPGGNRTATDANGWDKAPWTKQFTCASCHTPHGSYSFRLLHFNPNGMAQRSATNDGGLKFEVVDMVYESGKYYAYYLNTASVPAYGFTVMKTHFYNASNTYLGTIDGQKKTTDSTFGVAQYVYFDAKLTAPWLYGYEFDANKNKVYYADIYLAGTPTTQRTKDFNIRYDEGWAQYNTSATGIAPTVSGAFTGRTSNTNVKANIPAVLVVPGPYRTDDEAHSSVKLGVGDNPATLTGVSSDISGVQLGNKVAYKDGFSYNLYCASCHTDYERALTNPGIGADEKTGVYSQVHRHTTWRGATNGGTMEVRAYTETKNGVEKYNIMCVSCHFVHGTDNKIMKTADELVIGAVAKWQEDPANTSQTITEAEYLNRMGDVNISSAIKRYTNMSVCWKCHTDSKASTFKNSKYFWENISEQAPGEQFGYGW